MPIIIRLANLSFQSGKFSACYKCHHTANYRPISNWSLKWDRTTGSPR